MNSLSNTLVLICETFIILCCIFVTIMLIDIANHQLSPIAEKQSLPVESKELTTDQINALVELGVIDLKADSIWSENDIPMKMRYEFGDVDCYVFQDIFGNYYCRWYNG